MKQLWIVVLSCAGCASSPRDDERVDRPPTAAVARPPAPPREFHPWSEAASPSWLGPPDPALREQIIDSTGRLSSGDFAEYARAARRLVEIGRPAIPVLGSFGDLGPEEEGARGLARLVLAPIFARLPSPELGLWMEAPHATTRAAAARAAGLGPHPEHAHRLVDLLEDEDRGVRREAIVALRRLSKRFLGYRPDDSPERRAKAVDLWRKHWGGG